MSLPFFERGVPLSRHTTFRIGGPAAAFYEAGSAEEVAEASWKAEGQGLPWQVIGHGSNILASDEGYQGAVIVYRDERPPSLGHDGTVTASGGLSLAKLISFMAESGKGGLTDLAGIPGTVGGAIAGNAGAYGTAVSDRVLSLLILDRNGSMRRAYRDDLSFSYRSSSIKENGFVVLEATFAADDSDPADLKRRIGERLADRANKHPDPREVQTAGSFFKNPAGDDGRRIPAGRLLEEAGCLGLKVGLARPWHCHANIIVADEGAKARHVRELSERMKEFVGEKFGIELSREVILLGEH